MANAPATAPKVLPVEPDGIPSELRRLPRWVPWRYDWREARNGKAGQWAKVPYQVSGEPARSNDPATWGAFDAVLAEYSRCPDRWAGVGFVLGRPTSASIWTGRSTGGPAAMSHGRGPFGRSLPSRRNLSTRVSLSAGSSPTPKSAHRARASRRLSGRRCRRAGGKSAGKMPAWKCTTAAGSLPSPATSPPAGQSVIAEAGAFVAELHAAVFGQRKAAQANHRPAGFQPSDDQVLDAIRRARNGGRLARLLAGNASGYSSPSEADAALACGLAFWTRDPDQIGRLMRQSGLIRDKYDRRDYLPRTIGRTLGQATESYDWGRRARIRPAIERAERIERAETTECDRGGNVPVVLSADPVESAIRDTLPKVVGRMSRQVFELARALKAIPTYSDAPAEAVRQHLKRWHRLGTEAGTVTDSFTDTWIAFAMGWPKVKFPLGADAMSTIVERARAAAVPKCAERYDSPHVSFLASLCRELQAEAGNKPFYLSCATAGRLLAVDATTAWRYLWLLQHDRIIEVVEKGHQGRATRFKYAGD